MSYLGGLGAGKGWNKALFFPTPEYLAELLCQDWIFFINNSRVPVAYISSSMSDYLNDFRGYYQTVADGGVPDGQIVGKLNIGLTHANTTFAEKLCEDEQYKILYPAEPEISLGPCQMDCDKVALRVGSGVNYEHAFGLVMLYPKVFSTDKERHEVLHVTDHLPNRLLWDHLVGDIRKNTGPVVATNENREFRTRMRISADAVDVANSHHLLRKFGFSVKRPRSRALKT